jgi:LruC domain-containing protein
VTKETNNYIDSNNMVWALMLPTANFKYPTESTKIYDAYPKFKLWTASAGTTNTNWYTFAESGLVYNK